jgi:hypothetical protein
MSGTSKARIDPDGEEREGRMPMQLADFPRWLRALFAVFLILFFFNALYALAFFTAIWHLRIDPGVATLMGAIVGLGIVAWQARGWIYEPYSVSATQGDY